MRNNGGESYAGYDQEDHRGGSRGESTGRGQSNRRRKRKARIEAQAQAIHKKYMEEADEEIAKNEAYLEKLYERKLSEEEAKQESVMIKLRSDFENNRDRWVDEIVNRVIG